MTNSSTPATRRPIPTLLEAGTRFDGLVTFRGAVRVEGLVVGQVVAEGTLWLAAEGELRGRIEADEVLVEGACEGEIAARDRIELRPTARVRGQMTAPRVVMNDGARFDGRWLAGSPAASAGTPKPCEEPAADPDPAAASAPRTASIPA